MARWTTKDSEELYHVADWGLSLFGINAAGHLVVRPNDRDDDGELDLFELAKDLQKRGIEMPVLVRLTDVLRARVSALAEAFEHAIAELEYESVYRGVYPIKVNQQRHVVEEVVRYSRPYHMGLECGSKPELLIVLAELDDPDAVIICNGYKDAQFIELALLARKLGRNVIVVIEQMEELDLILRLKDELGVEPVIGVRAKLSSTGTGRWKGSAGDRAKFGLSIREIVELVRRLRDAGELAMLKLLHFHIGSQISSIRAVREALQEGTRVYTELVRMGAPMGYLDVGGGLGVDYDGSRSMYSSSMNYDMQEYANAVVSTIRDGCIAGGDVPHPVVITEAGRAMVAHSAVLIMPVVSVTSMDGAARPHKPSESDWPALHKLWAVYQSINRRDPMQAYHDAVAVRDEVLLRFNVGLSSLEERAEVEGLFWHMARRLLHVLKEADHLPEEMRAIQKALADTYFCNFSLFQSAPDSWAIDQIFPVLPIHRLDEEPSRRAVLTDLTCDSDGKIDRFIDHRDTKNVLEVHEPDGQPYFIGVFLLGAYQEILGDLHNLFGDTNAVHVGVTAGEKGYRIKFLVEGDTVRDVLGYVQYGKGELIRYLRESIEEAYEERELDIADGKRLIEAYERAMEGYTYLGS